MTVFALPLPQAALTVDVAMVEAVAELALAVTAAMAIMILGQAFAMFLTILAVLS